MLPNTPYVIFYYIIYALMLKSIAFNIIEFKKGKKVISFILLVLLELAPNMFLNFRDMLTVICSLPGTV